MSSRSYVRFQDDHIYYNVTIYNGTPVARRAEFLEERTEPIVYIPKDYHLSITRFEIPMATVPIFVWPNTNGVPDNTFFQVTLFINAGDFVTTPVVYVPLATNEERPQIFSYQAFLDLINAALATSFAGLAAPPAGSVAPMFVYDADTKLMALRADAGYLEGVPGNIQIWVNGNLFTYFEYFKAFFRGWNNADFRDFRFMIEDTGNNTISAGPPAVFEMKQETQGLDLWSSIRKVVFTTHLVPVKSEYISSLGGDGTNIFRSILTDFEPLIGGSQNPRETLQYAPSAEYKLTDLLGEIPLRKFDIQVYWETQTQELIPIDIPPFKSITIKFMFRKKSVIK
jgi:hypothetical protein